MQQNSSVFFTAFYESFPKLYNWGIFVKSSEKFSMIFNGVLVDKKQNRLLLT